MPFSFQSLMLLKERANRLRWGRHFEGIITCIGSTFGLGNVWRFPYLAYSHGGGGFLIPYCICLVLLGIPIFFLEIYLGQFASLSIISVWKINPLFKGLGYTIVTLTSIITIYYSVIIAICVYFMFASLDPSLPWMSCDNEWNTCYCRTTTTPVESEDLVTSNGLNCSEVNVTSDSILLSTHEYYFRKVLELTSGIDHPGKLKWDLTLCNLFVFVAVFIVISQGIKSMKKMVFVSALLPYVLMTALLVQVLALPGAQQGMNFYLKIDTSRIFTALVWKNAASQILFSLGCCMGLLTTMTSYNSFNGNIVIDSFIIPIINCMTSFYAGLVLFVVLGFLAEATGKDFYAVTDKGPGLAFVAFSAALAEMPEAQVTTFVFFLLMILLGLGSLSPLMETIVTTLQDEFAALKTQCNTSFRFGVCLIFFLLSLPLTTQSGLHLLDLCDTFIEFPMLVVGLLQLVAVMWIYGPKRFTEDLTLMLGYKRLAMILYYIYFKGCLIAVTPLILMAIITYNIVDYEYNWFNGSLWPEVIGWLMVAVILVWTPLWYFGNYCKRGGWKLLQDLNQPTIDWGPAYLSNRRIPRYKVQLKRMKSNLHIVRRTSSNRFKKVLDRILSLKL